jgi:hypothetical protein
LDVNEAADDGGNDPVADPPPVPTEIERNRSERMRAKWAKRYARLERSRSGGPVIATARRFFDIDGLTHSGLLAVELFTTVIPLMVLGFSYLSGFAENESPGNVFINTLGLGGSSANTVRSAFSSSSALRSTWTIFGVASFLVWGIPMSITVASMFAAAWRREQFSLGSRLWRGAVWFIAYLSTLALQAPVTGAHHPLFARVEFAAPDLFVVWLFWTLSPVLLVRDGRRGGRSLLVAGLAGVLIEGLILPATARIAFPMLLDGWTGFGPIGVAMTLMTWCGVVGIGWVVAASAGAVFWERHASTAVVVMAQTEDEAPSAMWWSPRHRRTVAAPERRRGGAHRTTSSR